MEARVMLRATCGSVAAKFGAASTNIVLCMLNLASPQATVFRAPFRLACRAVKDVRSVVTHKRWSFASPPLNLIRLEPELEHHTSL
jgi:hypothetical protein